MRRIAAALDTGPASLDAYVASREELLGHCVQQVLAEGEPPTGATWQETLRDHAHRSHAALARHGDIARLFLGNIPEGPHLAVIMERLLQTMIDGGVPPQVAAWGLDVLSLYVAATAYEEWVMSRVFLDDTGRPSERVAREHFESFAARIAQLPADRFPFVTRYVGQLTHGSGEERFAFGVDMLVAGMAAQVPPSAQAPASAQRARGGRARGR